MRDNSRLTTEVQKNGRQAKLTFFAFWLVNAVTTFQFGVLYVEALYRPLFEMLPISELGVATLAAISGGLSALLVLDVAYMRWQFIKLNCCETAEQYEAAKSAEGVSFILSLAYTGIALATTVFVNLIPPGLLNWIDIFGAVSFVGVCIYHLICWKQWSDNAPAVRETENVTTTAGQQLSERLAYEGEVMRSALIEAKSHADGYKDQIAAQLGKQWGEAMVLQLTSGQSQPTDEEQTTDEIADFLAGQRRS